MDIRQLTADEVLAHKGALADVLVDCVNGGASVSFLAPLERADAESFFARLVEEVRHGHRILLAAFAGNQLIGTVQVVLAMPPNQPHRADVAKLLVLQSSRGQGIAAQLMEHVEEASRRAGKTVLVLDTATGGAAERLYTRWVEKLRE